MKIRSDKRMNSYKNMKDENEISMGMMQWDEAQNTGPSIPGDDEST